MTKPERCSDCQNINTADRREADAEYRGKVLQKLEGYDVTLPKIEKALIDLTTITQENFNKIYFRIGLVSGTIGLITGSMGALAMLHLNS